MLNGLSCETLSYLNNLMVRHIDLSWNTLEPSLILMYQKLVDLGWTYSEGGVSIIEP